MRRRALLVSTAASLSTAALSGCLDAAGTGSAADPDHAVHVENEHDESHTIGIQVSRVREDVVVYDAEHELAAGESTVVYDLSAANPEGVEPFKIHGRLDGETTTATVETSECYGDVWVSVGDDGELDSHYAVC